MKGLKCNLTATFYYRMAFLLKSLVASGTSSIFLIIRKIIPTATATMKLNFSYGLLGIRLLDHVFPGAGEMGFPVISEMLLISIISFQFPASTSIFMNAVVVSLSPGFLLCKGMAVLSDTKHQALPYSAKTFLESLPQMLHIWVFQKTFYRIVGCSDSWEPPSLYARKKAI